ncbi:MAG: hypothetical protein M1836_008004 [Candelina mexicana]|nr:MAG: hypothetical protein M1836_008004 [Candelina mexicana]
MVPFGFSAGDIAMAVKVIAKASSALKDAGGSASEYQEVLQYLKGLLLTLQHLQNLNIQPNNPALLNAIRAQCASSAKPVLDFVNSIQEFNDALGVRSSKAAISGSHKKVQWGLFVSKGVEKLRSKIGANLEIIHLLLESHNAESIQEHYKTHNSRLSTLSAQVAMQHQFQQHLIKELENIRLTQTPESSTPCAEPQRWKPRAERHIAVISRHPECGDRQSEQAEGERQGQNKIVYRNSNAGMLCQDSTATKPWQYLVDTLEQILPILYALSCHLLRVLAYLTPQLLRALRTLLRLIPRQPTMLLEDNISFEDALGRIHSLQYAYFRDWTVFEAMLRVKFKAVPGEYSVSKGQYRIVNTVNGRCISQQNWNNLVFPGTQVAMSIIMEQLLSPDGRCPRPKCRGKAASQVVPLGSVCSACALEFSQSNHELAETSLGKELRLNQALDSYNSPTPIESNVSLRDKSYEFFARNVVQDVEREWEEVAYFRRVHLLMYSRELLTLPEFIRAIFAVEILEVSGIDPNQLTPSQFSTFMHDYRTELERILLDFKQNGAEYIGRALKAQFDRLFKVDGVPDLKEGAGRRGPDGVNDEPSHFRSK